MWVLIMIVLLNGSAGVTTSHLYYENEGNCRQAANEFESHKGKDVKLKAFCIKGDN